MTLTGILFLHSYSLQFCYRFITTKKILLVQMTICKFFNKRVKGYHFSTVTF